MGIFPVIFSKHPINSPITVLLLGFIIVSSHLQLAPPMRLGTERQDRANLHGHIPGVSTAFNSGAAPPVLRAGQHGVSLCTWTGSSLGSLPKLSRCRLNRYSRRRTGFAVGSPPAGLGARCCGTRLFRWLSVLLVFSCQGAAGEIFPYPLPFYKTSSERNT